MTYKIKGFIKLKQFFSKLKDMLNNFQKSSSKIIFADNEYIKLNFDEKYDIILSPSYYWVKKEKLPVSYTYQAKSYASAIFEGSIPKGNYNFLAQKKGEYFILFAYNDLDILQMLERIGIKSTQISKVYFAQSEFESINEPILLNENEALAKNDDILIKLPAKFLHNGISLKEAISSTQRSKNYINLSKFSQVIEPKSLYKALVALTILIVLYSAQFISLNNALKEQTKTQSEIYTKYKLPKTSIQLNSMIKNLENTAKKQKNLRNAIHEVLKTPLEKDEYLLELKQDSNKIELSYKLKSNENATKVKKYLEKNFKLSSAKLANDKFIVEMSYE